MFYIKSARHCLFAITLSFFSLYLTLLGTAALAQDESREPSTIRHVGSEMNVDVSSDGAFRYSVPIKIPEYRNITPSISLDYSSSRKSVGGVDTWVGPGWSLSGLGAIERKFLRGGLPSYADANDVYYLNGQELVACNISASSNSYPMRYPFERSASRRSSSCSNGGNMSTLVDNFQRIELIRTKATFTIASQSSQQDLIRFEVTRPDGVVYFYEPIGAVRGGTTFASVGDYRAAYETTFVLVEIRDTQEISEDPTNFRNAVKVNYSVTGAQQGFAYTVKDIRYGSGYVVDFRYKTMSNDDAMSRYAIGTTVERSGVQLQRLEQIRVNDLNGSDPIRAYQLKYQMSALTDRSVLTSVQEFASNYQEKNGSLSGSFLPEHKFSYPVERVSFTRRKYQRNFASDPLVLDMDLDGSDDLVFGGFDISGSSSNDRELKVFNFSSNEAVFDISNHQDARNLPEGTSNHPGEFERTVSIISRTSSSFHDGIETHGRHYAVRFIRNFAGTRCPDSNSNCNTKDPHHQDRLKLVNLRNGKTIGSEVTFPSYVIKPIDALMRPLIGNFDGDGNSEVFYRGRMYDIGSDGFTLKSAAFLGNDLPNYPSISGLNFPNQSEARFRTAPLEFVTDLDGDGTNEIVAGEKVFRFVDTEYTTAASGITKGVQGMRTYTLTNSPLHDLGLKRNVVFGDVNGDGAQDAIIHVRRDNNDGDLMVSLSNGRGFLPARHWIAPGSSGLANDDHTTYAKNMSLDVNGDGLSDMIIHDGTNSNSPTRSLRARVFISTGNGFVRASGSDIDNFQGVGDFDGDGDIDIVSGNYKRSTSDTDPAIYWQRTDHSFEMSSVVNPLGSRTEISYGAASHGGEMRGVQRVVKTISQADGRGQTRTNTYFFSGNRYSYTFARPTGFTQMIVTEPNNVPGADPVRRIVKYGDTIATSGMMTEEEVFVGDTLYSRVIREYEADSANHTRAENTAGYTRASTQSALPFRILPHSVKTGERHGDRVIDQTTTTEFTSHGQPSIIRHSGLDGDEDDVNQRFGYRPDIARYIVSRPFYMMYFKGEVWNWGDLNSRLSGEFYAYDGNTGSVGIDIDGPGNLTRRYAWNGASTGGRRLIEEMSYSDAGNILTRRDANGNTSSFAYTRGMMTRATNALGHVTNYENSYLCRERTQETDPNGLISYVRFDDRCREIQSRTTSGFTTLTRYRNIGSPTAQYVETQSTSADLIGRTSTFSRSYFDGFGQPYLTTQSGGTEDIADAIVTRRSFDVRGNVSWESVPLRWDQYTNHSVPANWRSTMQYDVLGRVLQVANANGAKSTTRHFASRYKDLLGHNAWRPAVEIEDARCYDGDSQTICGRSQQISDADGNTVVALRFDDAISDTIATNAIRRTYYQYDDLNRLTNISDPIGARWEYEYDVYSDRIRSIDPGLGAWTMQYDANHNLVRQTDALGNVISFTYDPLNRVLQKNVDAAGTGADVTTNYGYDEFERNGVYNIGQMTSEEVGDVHRVEYGYGKGGNRTSAKNTINGRNYLVQFRYTATNQLLRTRLHSQPNSTSTSWLPDFRYDTANRMVGFGDYVTGAEFDLWNNQTNAVFGNGATLRQRFDARQGWMLSSQVLTAAGTNADNTVYKRTLDGRVREKLLAFHTEGWNYRYDYGGRLVSAFRGRNVPQDFAAPTTYIYDRGGNMRFNQDVGTYAYRGGTHRPTQVNDEQGNRLANLTYDANGNMLTGLDGKVMEYDGENRPLSVTLNGNKTEYVYGAGGERLFKTENVGTAEENTTVYFDMTEIRNFGQRDDEVVMTYPHQNVRFVNGEVSYLHHDQLGSVRTITNDAGQRGARFNYEPFGEQNAVVSDPTTTAETVGFIGERYDAGAGLQYLNARYYDPKLGVFLQPDWFEVTDPGVGTNRYAYSGNDPINQSDPNGNIFGAASKLAKFVFKGGDAAATFGGAISDVSTIFSRGATLGQRVGAAASLATEVLSPVSARDAKHLGQSATTVVDGIKGRLSNGRSTSIGERRAHHDAHRSDVVDELRAQGNRVSDGEASFGAACGTGRCRPDILYEAPDGRLGVVEIKTGRAGESARQRQIFPQLRDGSAIPRGEVAGRFGLRPGIALKDQGFPNGISVDTRTFPGVGQ